MCKIYEEKDRIDMGAFLGGLLLGGLIGATVAALTTPCSGEETKEGLMVTYRSGLDRAEIWKDQTRRSLSDFTNLTQDKVKVIVQDLKDRANILMSRFDDLTNRGAGVLIEDEIV